MISGVFQLNAVKERDKESPAEEIGVTQGDCGRTQGCVGPCAFPGANQKLNTAGNGGQTSQKQSSELLNK